MPPAFDPQAFATFERAGWQRVGGAAYDATFGLVSRQSAGPLLEAVGVRPGMCLLDVACGPGYVTLAAAAQGARAIGLDFEPAMFAAAQQAHPEIEFRQGDAQALPFPDESVDAVTCSFGILHFPEPERALAEAWRVLKRGGRYALTDWLPPAPGTLRGLLAAAIAQHGDAAGKLPPGPPLGQFADEALVAAALRAVGFREVGFRVLALEVNGMPASAVAAMIGGGLVRTRGLMEAQSPQAQAAIRQALFESARALEREGEVHIPAPAALSWAVKP